MEASWWERLTEGETGFCSDGRGHAQFSSSSVQPLSRVQLFGTPWTAACQASLSNTSSRSLYKLTSIELVMPSNHIILCHPLSLLTSIFPSIRVFSNESVLGIRWPKYWSFSFSISPANEYSGLVSFRIDWSDYSMQFEKQINNYFGNIEKWLICHKTVSTYMGVLSRFSCV